jgi:hypothetical protein
MLTLLCPWALPQALLRAVTLLVPAEGKETLIELSVSLTDTPVAVQVQPPGAAVQLDGLAEKVSDCPT